MSPVRSHDDGATLAVRAQPGARKNAVTGVENGMLRVSVTAPPEDGRANDAILDLLRKVFKLRRSQIELLSGATHRNKVILIRGVTAEELATRLP